jgi:hypothetical protein
MTERNVQEFRASESDFYELGDPKTLELTDDEIASLHAGEGEPILLDRYNGFFMLIEE